MKKLNYLIAFIISFTVFLSFTNVFAATDMVLERKTYIATDTRNDSKFYTNKGYAYCITPDRIGAPQGTSFKYVSNMDDGGLFYLLDRAGESDTDYLTTQLAIWQYSQNYMPEFFRNHSNYSVVVNAKALANEATKNKNYHKGTGSISLSTNTSTIVYDSARGVYRSNSVRVNMTSVDTATLRLVNAPDGVRIMNSNGNVISSIKNNEEFYVEIAKEKVHAASNFRIEVTANYNNLSIERYADYEGKWQELIVLVKENKEIKQVVNYTIQQKTFSCEKDGNVYYDKTGKIVTYEEYSKQCERHTCERIGNTYFDKNSNIVDYVEYTKQCKRHVCEKIDNEYFGKDGNIVTSDEYQKQCVHICEIYNNEYYDKNGFKVSADEYKKQCEVKEVVVPNTKSSASIFTVLMSSTLLGTVIGVIEYTTKKKSFIK